MSSHTKGPWVSLGSSVITEADVPLNRTNGYGCGNDFICCLNDGEYHEYTSKIEQEANARLIAAAPDLLEATQKLKMAFGDPMTRRALGGHNEAQMTSILAAVDAIAKATGDA